MSVDASLQLSSWSHEMKTSQWGLCSSNQTKPNKSRHVIPHQCLNSRISSVGQFLLCKNKSNNIICPNLAAWATVHTHNNLRVLISIQLDEWWLADLAGDPRKYPFGSQCAYLSVRNTRQSEQQLHVDVSNVRVPICSSYWKGCDNHSFPAQTQTFHTWSLGHNVVIP